MLSLTADFRGHEAFYIAAPESIADIPSLELANEFYAAVPVHGDLSGTRGVYDCRKAERLLGWKHHP